MLAASSASGVIAAILGVVAAVLVAIFAALYRIGNTVGRMTESMRNLSQDVSGVISEQRSQGAQLSRHETAITVLQNITGSR